LKHHLYDFEVIMGCIAWERTITIAGTTDLIGVCRWSVYGFT